MSAPNKRTLMLAVQKLVHTNDPQMADFEAVTAALAQVFTDCTGVECKVVMKVNMQHLKEVLKEKGI